MMVCCAHSKVVKNGKDPHGNQRYKCALCGKAFVTEILLGKSVKSFTQAGSSTTFYAHDECLENAKSCKTLLDLPAASPLRQAYEQQQAETEQSNQGNGK